MAMTIEKKNEIRDLLQMFCDRNSGISRAAEKLTNVGSSTLRSILKSNYANISDEMFRNIRSQVGGTKNKLAIVDTRAVRDMTFCMDDAHRNKNVTWIIAKSGSGKTTSTEKYLAEHKNAFYVLCDEDMKKGDFAIALARAIGMRVNVQKKARDIIMQVIAEINEMDDVLIIFDEGDKISDSILHYFITIYNLLVDKAGIVFFSTSHMIRRMENGLKFNKRGYQEMFSRIGRKFYMAEENDATDVYNFCTANDITDRATINEVIKDATQFDFDMRRVKRKVLAVLRKRQISE